MTSKFVGQYSNSCATIPTKVFFYIYKTVESSEVKSCECPSGWKNLGETCILPYDMYCRKREAGTARLGCNWLQASMGCKLAGARLAEFPDPVKETKALATIDDEVINVKLT